MELTKLRKGLDRAAFYVSNFGAYYLPDAVVRMPLDRAERRLSDAELEEIQRRAEYYVRIKPGTPVEMPTPARAAQLMAIGNGLRTMHVDDFRYPFNDKRKFATYFFDLYPHMRHFPKELIFNYLPGDGPWECPVPTLMKTRLITEGYTNSALCRLNSVRHFRFLNDIIPYEAKSDIPVSRNFVMDQPWRDRLLELYAEDPRADFGQINPNPAHPQWVKPFVSIEDHLKHKFILCIQGNDVATNLKWVMSSNSIAVMPRPTVESWFMEAKLIPGVHYIEIKDDYSDLFEQLDHYLSRPDEAAEIIRNAHAWVDRFRNLTVEDITMRHTLNRYFTLTNQL